jgi:hypothetical protein
MLRLLSHIGESKGMLLSRVRFNGRTTLIAAGKAPIEDRRLWVQAV